jgi:uncharacterized protein YkwD
MEGAVRIVTLVVAVLGALLVAPTVALGAVVARTELEFPATVKVGQTGLTGTIVLANDDGGSLFALRSAGQQLAPGDSTVCNAGDPFPCSGPGIVLTPSCRIPGEGDLCEVTGADPGVFSFAATATGRAGSACPGRAFDVSPPLPDTGQLSIRPQTGNVILPILGVECLIDLQFSVLRLPTGDADDMLPGRQTFQYADAQQHVDEDLDSDRASSEMTVSPATPSLATAASPSTAIGGAVTGTATLSGAASPAGQPIQFRLFGPDDAGCANPIFTTSAPMNAAGVATSPPFTPPSPGAYRWTATYAGNAENVAAEAACNAPGSSVAVLAAAVAPPPPPPPPPVPGATPDGPQILSTTFSAAPRVGQLVFLEIRAKDPLRPISGVQVSFGEPRGLTGISACSVPSLKNSVTPQLLRVPYVFTRPGTHTITITVLSGGCSQPSVRTVTTITITIAPAAATRSALAAAAASAPTSGACPNRLLLAKNTPYSRNQVAAAVLCAVNAERRKRGLKKLARSTVLAKAATNHSKDMLKRRYFNHVGPRGPAFGARLKRVRYRGATAAENIGYGGNFNAELIVRAWMNSPGHRANILRRNMSFAGLGVVVGLPVTPRLPGTTYTMVFGKSRR